MLQAAEYANPAAQSAAQSRHKTCGLSAIAAAQQCLTYISKCSVQFDCLQFSDMVIASGPLTALQDSSSGPRMLQIYPIVKDLSKAWLLRNYSKSITLVKGTSKQELGLGYSESEVYSVVASLAGSAYCTSVLHLRLDFEKASTASPSISVACSWISVHNSIWASMQLVQALFQQPIPACTSSL